MLQPDDLPFYAADAILSSTYQLATPVVDRNKLSNLIKEQCSCTTGISEHEVGSLPAKLKYFFYRKGSLKR